MSYRLAKEELEQLLDNLNGIYIHGDSVQTVKDLHFQDTFLNIIEYVQRKNNEENANFSAFLMGHSLHNLVKSKVKGVNLITEDMGDLVYKNLAVTLKMRTEDTFLF